MKAVLITTQHRGVFFGMVEDGADLTAKNLSDIKDARMAVYFGTTRGLMQLAKSGPTERSKISDPADLEILHDVTAVFSVTDEAKEKWIAA